MIVVRVLGGLGNQLFQYAAGAALAARVGAELRLDLQGLRADPRRAYGLDRMGVIARAASADESARLRRWKGGILDRAVRRMGGRGLPPPRSYFAEPGFEYAPAFEHLADGTYLDGYWQSPRYFDGIEERLRAELSAPPAGREATAEGESVGVHVRRGDYLSDPHTRALHPTCTVAYYSAAVAALRETVRDPHFLIFSDEPERAAESWPPAVPATVMPLGPHPADDLRRMARCRHHIIANSSFSWWGAWLGRTSRQQVVAPRRWFVGEDRSTRDLIPAGWKILS